jgi:hypothetical protein
MSQLFRLDQFAWVPERKVLIGEHARLHASNNTLMGSTFSIIGHRYTLEFTLGNNVGRTYKYGQLYVPTNAPEEYSYIQVWYFGQGKHVTPIKELWP